MSVTLQDVLKKAGERDDRYIGFINGGNDSDKYTYSEILEKSLNVLGYLQEKGLKKGDKLIFQLDDNYFFVTAFWACIMGGIVAVPVVNDTKSEFLHKFFRIFKSIRKSYVICNQHRKNNLIKFSEENDYNSEKLNASFLSYEQALMHEYSGKIVNVKDTDTAFIQYSSGSTGAPKGVVLSQKNIVLNVEAITEELMLTDTDVCVYWLPLTHDMGIIGCHITAAFNQISQYVIPTKLFGFRPKVWLDKITEYKASIIVSSNFGLQLALKAVKRKSKDYDLSHVRAILNGAEPISVDVCKEFHSEMSKFGLYENAMLTVYGMAEATLAITFPKLGDALKYVAIDRSKLCIGESIEYVDEKEDSATLYVEEGTPVKHVNIRICDDNDSVVCGEILGNIQIKGDNVSKGYYNNGAENKKSRTNDGWFRTGDIGFIHKGNLVVVGRAKEMLIINGYNYFATDLERIALEISNIKNGKIAITDVYDKYEKKEKIAVFIIYKKNYEDFIDLVSIIRKEFIERIGIIPDYIIPVDSIPKTSSGKLARFELKKTFENGGYSEKIKKIKECLKKDDKSIETVQRGKELQLDIEQNISEICREELPNFSGDVTSNLFEEGITSILVMKIYEKISMRYPNVLGIEDIFEYYSVQHIAKEIYNRVNGIFTEQSEVVSEQFMADDEIAIIGMSASLPGAANIDEFWDNIKNGLNCVGNIPSLRKNDLIDYTAALNKDAKYAQGGYLAEIDKFDNRFFNIMDNEAVSMSPMQRIFMQIAYSAVEDSGYGGDALRGSKTGIYVGYVADLESQQYQELIKHSNDKRTATGSLSTNISGRFSYFMDFRGPSLNIDSACSSSFSALNAAIHGIKNGDCEQAVVGSVQIKVLPFDDNRIGVESDIGIMRPFDEKADGLCEGEGAAAVIVKKLSAAKRDKDNIYAIIKSIAVNSDGKSMGLSVPNPKAQHDMMMTAMGRAKLSVNDIDFIETHGTATNIGDPIELNVLSKIFRNGKTNREPCYIGAVKSNVGHLYSVSGLVSIIKCCYELKTGIIPPVINFNKINSKINIDNSGLYINTNLVQLTEKNDTRKCCINNFGFSGTNGQIVLEEYKLNSKRMRRKKYPIFISAKGKENRDNMIRNMIDYLLQNPTMDICDVSYTLIKGRDHYKYRFAVAAETIEELIEKLKKFDGRNDIDNDIYVGESQHKSQDHYLLNLCNEIAEENKKEIIHKKVNMLCQIYVNGGTANYRILFKNDDVNTVKLPTYEYTKRRFWPKYGE